jgi:NADH:ubiquinone oxidoreductase subunit E
MLMVRVCVGSSCHIRGGARTLKTLKSLIEQHGLADRVDLAADLCLDNCLKAPNVVVDGTTYGGIGPDKAERFFEEFILSKVGTDADTRDNINQ